MIGRLSPVQIVWFFQLGLIIAFQPHNQPSLPIEYVDPNLIGRFVLLSYLKSRT